MGRTVGALYERRVFTGINELRAVTDRAYSRKRSIIEFFRSLLTIGGEFRG